MHWKALLYGCHKLHLCPRQTFPNDTMPERHRILTNYSTKQTALPNNTQPEQFQNLRDQKGRNAGQGPTGGWAFGGHANRVYALQTAISETDEAVTIRSN